MKTDAAELLFIYNADSGIANGLLDYGKKYIAPSRYDCQLCMVSYGAFGMKRDWKRFVATLPYKVTFLHKDEFAAHYPHETLSLPAMVLAQNGELRTLLNAHNFQSIQSLSQLQEQVTVVLGDMTA